MITNLDGLEKLDDQDNNADIKGWKSELMSAEIQPLNRSARI